MSDPLPTDAFLSLYSEPIAAVADRLRTIVRSAVPQAIERVRPGWRLVGYELPIGRRRRYFAFVAPEREHVHLGFEHGAWMSDPEHLLEGAHLGLRQVRFVTCRPGDAIPEDGLASLVREAAVVVAMSGPERLAHALADEERLERLTRSGTAG